MIVDLNLLAAAIHRNNIEKGFYEREKNIGEMLCLIHSEVSEALEADRNNRYAMRTDMRELNNRVNDEIFISEYVNNVKGSFEEEMADIIIRVLDLCAYREIDIEQHIKAKMRANKNRIKYHGKKY